VEVERAAHRAPFQRVRRKPEWRAWFAALLFGLAYAAASAIGLTTADGLPVIWPAVGVGVAGVAILGRRTLPFIVAAEFMLRVLAGHGLGIALGLAVLAAVESWFAAWPIIRSASVREFFVSDVHGMPRFAARSVGILSLSSLLVVLRTQADGPTTPATLPALFGALSARTFGLFVVAPFLLSLPWSPRNAPASRSFVTLPVALALTVAVSSLVFVGSPPWFEIASPTAILPFILLIWISQVFGARGTSACTLAVGLVVLADATRHSPLVSHGHVPPQPFLLHLYILLLGVSSFLLSWGEALRQQMREALRRASALEALIAVAQMVLSDGPDRSRGVDTLLHEVPRALGWNGLAYREEARVHGAAESTGLRCENACRGMHELGLPPHACVLCPSGHASPNESSDDAHRLPCPALQVLTVPMVGEDVTGTLSACIPADADADGERPHLVAVAETLAMLLSAESARARRVSERAQRESLKEQLRRVQRLESLGTLAAGVAHDFNDVLQAVLSNAQVLADELPDGDARKMAHDTVAAATRGSDIVRRMLTFSRGSQSTRVLQDVRRVVPEAMTLLRTSLAAGVVVDVQLASTPMLVRAGSSDIVQILMNLCLNASHAMANAGGQLAISVRGARRAPPTSPDRDDRRLMVVLSVADTGHGMDEATRARIFDPFFTTREVGKGTGLGLSIVYGLVSDLDGWIELETSRGVGTRFDIYLPCAMSLMTCDEPRSVEGHAEVRN